MDRNLLRRPCKRISACRTPHGVRGSKSLFHGFPIRVFSRRTPHGVRGSKWNWIYISELFPWSHPARGAWIEMPASRPSSSAPCVAPRTGCVDRNEGKYADYAYVFGRTPHGVRGSKYLLSVNLLRNLRSHPARGAWIEIPTIPACSPGSTVAPRTGCVDRNSASLRAQERRRESHPARGAWIEISYARSELASLGVAPRTGCVDRNASTAADLLPAPGRTPHGVRGSKYLIQTVCEIRILSHPARGAWIEITMHQRQLRPRQVAPRTGCVDRNIQIASFVIDFHGRTPHGVRGSKF